jgi:hypothetical protein
MPATWELVYLRVFYILLSVVAALVLWRALPTVWESLMTGGWRPRAALALIVGWYVIMRIAARTNRFRALVERCQSSGLACGLSFHLLLLGLPLGVFAYLAPFHRRGDMFVSIVVMLILISIFAWRSTRKIHSDTLQ